MSSKVAFNHPVSVGRELEYVTEVMRSGHLAGNGPFAQRCEKLLAELMGAPRVLLTTSCTHALEMAALLLKLQPGDEVIVPAFTFVSTANAFALHGARPVFADVTPDTLNIDPRHVAQLIGPRTRAVVPVHYAGISCDMTALMELARSHDLWVIEDNAHGLMGSYQGKPLGGFGNLSTNSFHDTKNFTCGEGGALVVNDARLIERAEILRDKGTDRSKFFRGAVDKYSWVDVGSSYVVSDILAAYLFAQLEARSHIQERRRTLWTRYHEALRPLAERLGLGLPVVPPECEQTYHLYFLVMPTAEARDGLIGFLRERGIGSAFHYVPLHTSSMGRSFGGAAGACPTAESLSERLVRLPLHLELGTDDQGRVIEAVRAYCGERL